MSDETVKVAVRVRPFISFAINLFFYFNYLKQKKFYFNSNYTIRERKMPTQCLSLKWLAIKLLSKNQKAMMNQRSTLLIILIGVTMALK